MFCKHLMFALKWPHKPMGLVVTNFEEMKMSLFEKWAFIFVNNICIPLHHNILISCSFLFSFLFCACIISYSCEVFAPRHLVSKTFLVEIMDYKNFTLTPQGHKTYMEIKE